MKRLLVYNDLGVGPMSRTYTSTCLTEMVDTNRCIVSEINSHQLILDNWENQCCLLVIPGGADSFYHQLLSGVGCRKIRDYVERGGSYLGLCAGAYFATRAFEFDRGGELEILATRELSFFPGCAIGPAYGVGTYRYDSHYGARASKLSCYIDGAPSQVSVYSNGAPYFLGDKDDLKDVSILARYLDIEGEPAAIVECQVFKGKAILCGPYPIFSLNCLDANNEFIRSILSELETHDDNRRQLVSQILHRLGVPVAAVASI